MKYANMDRKHRSYNKYADLCVCHDGKKKKVKMLFNELDAHRGKVGQPFPVQRGQASRPCMPNSVTQSL